MEFAAFKASYTPDPVLSVEGADLDLGEGVRLKVALWMNPAFSAALQKATAKPETARKLERGELPAAEDRDMMDEVIARTILVGWEGLEENGKPIAYSPERARELLKAEFLRRRVIEFAQRESIFRSRTIAAGVEVLKKS